MLRSFNQLDPAILHKLKVRFDAIEIPSVNYNELVTLSQNELPYFTTTREISFYTYYTYMHRVVEVSRGRDTHFDGPVYEEDLGLEDGEDWPLSRH